MNEDRSQLCDKYLTFKYKFITKPSWKIQSTDTWEQRWAQSTAQLFCMIFYPKKAIFVPVGPTMKAYTF